MLAEEAPGGSADPAPGNGNTGRRVRPRPGLNAPAWDAVRPSPRSLGGQGPRCFGTGRGRRSSKSRQTAVGPAAWKGRGKLSGLLSLGLLGPLLPSVAAGTGTTPCYSDIAGRRRLFQGQSHCGQGPRVFDQGIEKAWSCDVHFPSFVDFLMCQWLLPK